MLNRYFCIRVDSVVFCATCFFFSPYLNMHPHLATETVVYIDPMCYHRLTVWYLLVYIYVRVQIHIGGFRGGNPLSLEGKMYATRGDHAGTMANGAQKVSDSQHLSLLYSYSCTVLFSRP